MKTEVEDLGGAQKKILCEIPPDEVDKEVEKYCRKLAKEVDIKGFRKGKAPPSIIKRYFRQQIQAEVASRLIGSSLEKAFEEHGLTPLGEPEIDAPALEEGKAFSFTVKLDVKPEVEVEDFEGIELERPALVVEEEEVDKSLEELRKAHGQLKGITEDRGVQEGDTVLVDYAAFIDGEAVPGHERKDVYFEIGPAESRQDTEEALLGAKVGEEREVEVEYPSNYLDTALAGKKVTYKLQVKKILIKELPDLDDEFAKDVGPFETLEALKEKLREQIRREKELRIRQGLEESLLDALLERNPFEAPRSLVEARHAQMMRDATTHFLSKGLRLERDSEDYERLQANLEELAEKEVKKHLLIEAVAGRHSIRVTEEDVRKRIEEIAAEHDQSVEKVRADIQKREEGMERFKTNLLRNKTLDFLLSRAKIKDKE